MFKVIEERISKLLCKLNLKIAFAESCTGGLVSHRITNVPGSSKYFLGSIVSYSNEAKNKLLGVKNETLKDFGAVSYQSASEMAVGVRNQLGADIGVAITGIAGPDGGTEKKPVGLVFIALSTKEGVVHKKFNFVGGREENKNNSANAALEMLEEFLLFRNN